MAVAQQTGRDLIVRQVDRARALLAQAKDAPAAKRIADMAHAAETYARRQHLSEQAIEYAHAIKIDALTLLGEFLDRHRARAGRPPNGAPQKIGSRGVPISDVGVTKKESATAGLLAGLKQVDPVLHEAVRESRATVTQVRRQQKEQAREQRRASNRAQVQATPTITAPVARFATIVIDPPWDWGDEGDVDQLGRARPTYDTMPLHRIAALPLSELSDADCHLYLWITNRSLPKGFGLLEGWGFRYVTCLTWCKPSFGMGNYFRGATEHVLFGVRGSQPLRRKDASTWFAAPRGPRGHSSKPQEFYALVESCSPGPYLEMFAREERSGWVRWGAEA